ncbi:MAG: hypothetical protein KGJ86_18590 [Chloroflexota bacterium]|nr:hypothetical protein [Chloroflexota bacterium]
MSKRWPLVLLGSLLLLLNPSGAPRIRADTLQLWGFNSPGDTAGLSSQPANGSLNQVGWVAQPSREGSGAIRIDYTGSSGFNTSVKALAPSLPWSITSITADVYVPAQVRIARLGLGLQIDGPPANKVDASIHLLNVRGGWNHMSWPIHPGQLVGAGHTLGFVLDTDEPMPGPLYVDDVRAVPASIWVDAAHVVSSFDPVTLWGNNAAYYYPRAFFDDPTPARLARGAGFSFFRIPGGLNSDVYHWNGNGIRTADGSIDPAARQADGTWRIDYNGWAPGF